MAEPTSPNGNYGLQRPRFSSLRAKLIASHGFVLLLALALVLAISGIYLRRYEQSAENERLRQVAVPMTIQTNFIVQRVGKSIGSRAIGIEVLDAEAHAMGVRLLVFNGDGMVFYDTDDRHSLIGQTLDTYARSIKTVLKRAQQNDTVQLLNAKRDGGPDPLAGDRLLLAAAARPKPSKVLGIAAPPGRYPLLGKFLPKLFLVTAASLAVASIAGYALSRWLAAPVDRLTRAADAMSAGKLEQAVPGEGPDEIGRLVRSFNAMSRQVAATARSQRDLLANVAHELRTPLTSVQGYALALRDRVIEDQADQDRALATIGRESERMASLIGQLLDLARLESGQAQLRMEPVAVEPLMERVTDRFRPEAGRRGVTLEAAGAPGLRLQGDEGRLIQILSNLVANAIRHTPAGGHVTASAEPVLPTSGAAGPKVRLTVRDTGEGIPPDRLPNVFDRFERGANRTDGDGAGFGLGLAITRELVQLHGGAIAVESEVGAGTTVTVDLPAVVALVA